MPLLPSLPETSHLSDLFTQHPAHAGPLMVYIDSILRNKSDLSPGTRELIAAYVSGLNKCTFCCSSHDLYAQAFGIAEGTVQALLENIDTAPVDENLRPVFRYVQKLTTLPPRLTPADAQAVFDAGWSEAALTDAIHICGAFNLMNRIVEGTGVNFDYTGSDHSFDVETSPNSYLDYAKRLGV